VLVEHVLLKKFYGNSEKKGRARNSLVIQNRKHESSFT
jgi:hypothetical protein